MAFKQLHIMRIWCISVVKVGVALYINILLEQLAGFSFELFTQIITEQGK